MPTSNERKMLSSNEALKELTYTLFSCNKENRSDLILFSLVAMTLFLMTITIFCNYNCSTFPDSYYYLLFQCFYHVCRLKLEGRYYEFKGDLSPLYIVKVTLNLSLLRCMLFANFSRNFHPIVMKFGKHYFLLLRQLP